MENISVVERTVTHDNNVVRSSLKLGKASITILSRFDGSDRLFDLLLSTAKEGLEKSIRAANSGYYAGGGSCYNKIGS